MLRQGRLLADSVYETKTAAGHFTKGYRGMRFGRQGKPRGSVVVAPVGPYWGVFDRDPDPRVRYITVADGIRRGRMLCGRG